MTVDDRASLYNSRPAKRLQQACVAHRLFRYDRYKVWLRPKADAAKGPRGLTTHVQSPIDALLFDLGGVLVDVDWSRAFRAWAEASGVPEAKIAARFKRDAWYQAHERGALDDPEFYAWLRRSLGVDLGEEQLLRGWNAILGDPFPGMDALLRLAASRRPVYVFSNTNVPHARHWRHRYAVLLRPVRGVFLSCELGCRKPDRRAFELVTAQIATAPNRIAFFDDVEENVDGAISAGLRAFHVRTPAELKATLARLLLIE